MHFPSVWNGLQLAFIYRPIYILKPLLNRLTFPPILAFAGDTFAMPSMAPRNHETLIDFGGPKNKKPRDHKDFEVLILFVY
jgi:hypothetical protein